MSAAVAVQELTTHLAHLSVRERPVEHTRMGVDAALHGRGAAMALCRQVLADVAQARGTSRADFDTLHAHPERVLATALRLGAREARSYSPSEVTAAADPRSVTARWEQLGAAATRAHLAWSGSETLPTGAAGRAAVGDIAVVALGIAHLDRGLVQAATRVGADDVARDLRFAERAGLHLAARAVLDRVSADAAPTWDAPGRARLDRLPVVPVNHADDLPRGLQRLHELLTAGVNVSPQHTVMLLTAQVRMSAVVAQQAQRTARATGDTAYSVLAQRMNHHAAALASSWGRSDRSLVGLDGPDPRPVHQAGECLRYLTGAATPVGLLEQTAGAVVGLAGATATAVEGCVASGKWATPITHVDSQAALSWRLFDTFNRPNVLDALRAVVAQAPSIAADHNRMQHLHVPAAARTPTPARG
ncbi:hypothetical protein [Kineococcus indalonis]|uniref:hypothetical protein n=1 Tax=Kineococcus indalonis TaxID=2696566 RepID=UPI00141372B8|nr:hypothetical protein [Kineococcus indalonis]NAZ87584.1 hypothetical protein [Kineococcus indalonis]